MNEYAQTLEQLRDIQLPPPPGFWPPAQGWWLLAGVILALLLVLWFSRRTRLRRRRRRQVWAELERLEQAWQQDGDSRGFVAALSALLRRVAMIGHDRHRVAALTGEPWLRFLDHACSHKEFVAGVGAHLMDGPYRQVTLEADQTRALYQLVRVWVGENM